MGIIIKQLVTLAIGTCEGFRRTYETSSNSSGINEAERDLTVLCTTERGAVRGDSETHVYTTPVASCVLEACSFLPKWVLCPYTRPRDGANGYPKQET